MDIEIFSEGDISLPYKGISRKRLGLYIKKVCKYLRLIDISITLIVTDNDYICKLNKRYRKKDYPTDIISFAYRESSFPNKHLKKEMLGDIYLSLEKALKQSEEYGVGFEDEVKHLLVHGVLHLIGYDHEISKEHEERMLEKEEEILRAI